MMTSPIPQLIAESAPFVSLATVKFVGLGFYFSLALLWLFVQGYVWLAERYSRLISRVQWWRSGLIALVVMTLMVIGWSFPYGWMGEGRTPGLRQTMTAALSLGAIASWILCGKLYQLDFLNRLVVALGIPILSVFSLVMGQIWYWKLLGGS